ncbi:MAG: metal ABC transporter substrate-binding protein [Candidatus Nanopelagicales bacterium]
MVRRATAVLACAAGLLLSGCAGTGSGDGDNAAGVSVVATTTVWGDVARQIVTCADGGQVTTLMPIGADPHDFAASSEDVALMVAADLVIANGLGLEEGLAAALESARSDGATIYEVAPMLDPIPFGDHGEEHEEAEVGDSHSEDPHVWLDAERVATAADLIGDALAERTGDTAFSQCGKTLQAELTVLDGQVSTTLSAVPADMRVLVTDHDAFGYFAQAYDFTVAATVIPGGSTLAKPSSAEMAALVETVESTGVPAIFANVANPQALVDALATEAGDVAVVPLYVGSLGEPGSGADTYQGMMTTNAERISAALAG